MTEVNENDHKKSDLDHQKSDGDSQNSYTNTGLIKIHGTEDTRLRGASLGSFCECTSFRDSGPRVPGAL